MPWTARRPTRSANGCERSSTRVSETVGTIAALWRFPLQARPGRPAGDGAAGGRGGEGGGVGNANPPHTAHPLMPGRATPAGDSVEIAFPDGTSIATDAPGADDALSAFFGSPVALERAAPDATIDLYN